MEIKKFLKKKKKKFAETALVGGEGGGGQGGGGGKRYVHYRDMKKFFKVFSCEKLSDFEIISEMFRG